MHSGKVLVVGGGGAVRCLCVFFIQVLIHEDSTVPGFQAAVEKKKKRVQGSFRALHLVFSTSGKEEREQDREEKFESASKPTTEEE